jgi:hypothetical protein
VCDAETGENAECGATTAAALSHADKETGKAISIKCADARVTSRRWIVRRSNSPDGAISPLWLTYAEPVNGVDLAATIIRARSSQDPRFQTCCTNHGIDPQTVQVVSQWPWRSLAEHVAEQTSMKNAELRRGGPPPLPPASGSAAETTPKP